MTDGPSVTGGLPLAVAGVAGGSRVASLRFARVTRQGAEALAAGFSPFTRQLGSTDKQVNEDEKSRATSVGINHSLLLSGKS